MAAPCRIIDLLESRDLVVGRIKRHADEVACIAAAALAVSVTKTGAPPQFVAYTRRIGARLRSIMSLIGSIGPAGLAGDGRTAPAVVSTRAALAGLPPLLAELGSVGTPPAGRDGQRVIVHALNAMAAAIVTKFDGLATGKTADDYWGSPPERQAPE